MKITGFQKTSLMDYPGYIVSIIFTQGCNFSCPYCHNSDLIPLENGKREYFPLSYIYQFLKKRKGLIDGICITGGEPTLQSDLYSFIKHVKEMNLKIKLDTNGSKPALVKNLVTKKLINYLAMDIKGPLDRYHEIVGKVINTDNIKKSISLIKKSGIDYEFRTTVVPGLHCLKDIKKIGYLIKGANKFFIQNFKPKNTFNKSFLRKNGFPPVKLKEFKETIKPYVKYVEIRD